MSKDNRMALERHELLSDVAKQVSLILKEYNIAEADADEVGNAVTNHLSEHWGGQVIIIPKDHIYKITQRDLEIFDKVTHNNMHEVAKEYNLTINGLYRVLRRIRKRAIDLKQPGLFE